MCLRKFKIFYRKIFPGHRYSVVPRLLNDCDSVLDLGCGPISPLHFCNIIFSVGVDIFEPYLIQSKKKEIHNEYILSNVLDIEFRPKSFDAVVSLEILEHISKKDGYKLIEKMKKYARKKIIITTPNGFCDHGKGAVDGNINQIHICGWTVKELEELGFKVKGIRGWIVLKAFYNSTNKIVRFIAERVSDITQKITYHFPQYAFRLVAVYYINE